MKSSLQLLVFLLLVTTVSCQKKVNKIKDNKMLYDKIPTTEYNRNMMFYTDRALPGTTLTEMLENTTIEMKRFITSIPEEKIDHAYSYGKWTIGEVIQHVISYEQIMLEVALLNAGKISEKNHTRYYNQATTVAGARGKSKNDLLEEFLTVRKKTQEAFNSLSEEEQKIMGTLDGNKTSVRIIAFCISGHQVHHFDIIKDRYL